MNKQLLKARSKNPKLETMLCASCGHVKELFLKGEFCKSCLFILTSQPRA